MLVKIPRGWEIPERRVTPEHACLNRRRFLSSMVALGGIAGLRPAARAWAGRSPNPASPNLPPMKAEHNAQYTVDHPITSERVATHYNNYYEFTEIKDRVWQLAENFHSRPWEIQIKGQVEKPRKVDVDELIRQMPIEERVYHHRCVEAWTIFVPWIGFPMKKFVEWCAPTGKARFIRMVSFLRPSEAEGQRLATWYPWPYYEALTIEEASNELALLVVGMYGKTLPNQNGAPLRLHVPWKYGYKSIKGITLFEFTSKQPANFWNVVVPSEYDFQANVNPNKPHPRWSQATERIVETGERIPTRLYNGYEEYVAHLYK